MAVGVSKKIKLKLARHPNIRWRHFTYPVRKSLRRFLRWQSQSELVKANDTRESGWFDFTLTSEQVVFFQEKSWVFIEEFLPKELHSDLVREWPKKRWFDPLSKKQVEKTYDTAFMIDWDEHVVPSVLESVLNTYRIFRSDQLAVQISRLMDKDVVAECYWTTLNNSFWGTGLAPHRDTPSLDLSGFDRRINLVYFVEANGEGWDSGGTSILATNDFTSPIFVPTVLKNSLLVYRTGAEFFHGFPPVRYRKFRRAMTAHFRVATP